MFVDIRGVITKLGQLKLDYMLGEIKDHNENIPDVVTMDEEDDIFSKRSRSESLDKFGTFGQDWYKTKDWKMFTI